RCVAMRARLLPEAPIQPASGSRGFSALVASSDQIRIALRTPIVEKPPTLLRFTYALEINNSNEDFLFRTGRASYHFAKRIRNEGATPKAKIALAANAINGSYKDAIQRRMSAHCVFPTPRRERLIALQRFEPADRRRIKDDLRTLNGVDARCFRIPLVVTNQRSDNGFARIYLHVSEIAG